MRLPLWCALALTIGGMASAGCDSILGIDPWPEDAGVGAGASTGTGAGATTSPGGHGGAEDTDPVGTTTGTTTTSSGVGGGGPCMPDAGAKQHDDAGAETCGDCVKNGDESDVDCGGKLCRTCEPMKTCNSDVDCANGGCLAGLCR